jgi:hypothetical protein
MSFWLVGVKLARLKRRGAMGHRCGHAGVACSKEQSHLQMAPGSVHGCTVAILRAHSELALSVDRSILSGLAGAPGWLRTQMDFCTFSRKSNMSTCTPCCTRLPNRARQLSLITAHIHHSVSQYCPAERSGREGANFDTVSTASQAANLPHHIEDNASPADIDKGRFPPSTDVLDSQLRQDISSYTDAAFSSHSKLAPLDHDKDSTAVTTHSAPTFERVSSNPMSSEYVEPSIQQDQYTEYLDRVEEKQEVLRDVRESLLGSRFRLHVQRRELNAIRAKAASQAGMAFNLLRQYLVETGINPPGEIESALSEAEALRNTLGTEEVEYDEAEKAYNFEEWRYTAKESQFIEELYESAPAPSQPDGSYSGLNEHEDSTQISFGGARDIANLVAESQGDPYLPVYNNETPFESEDDLSESQGTVPGDTYQRNSDLSTQDNPAIQNSKEYPAQELLFEESAIENSHLRWAGTSRYVDEWLLESLVTSRLEQGRLGYHAIVENTLGDQEWRDHIGQTWFLDTTEERDFHTGDTTVSEESRSEPFSSNTMHRLFNSSNIAEYETQQFPPTPLLGQDRVVDAPELANFPTDIEPLDLIDIFPRDTTFLDRSCSTHSASTHPTALTRASSRMDCSSRSTVEGDWIFSTGPGYDIAQPRVIPPPSFVIKDSQYNTKPRATLIHGNSQSGSAYGPSPLSSSISQTRLDFHDVHFQQLPESPYTLIEGSSAHATGGYTETGTIQEEDQSHLPAAARKHDLDTYEPHIRVESPDSWNLPVYD